jgi:hypothetical protein
MKKKKTKKLFGEIPAMPDTEIFLNVTKLENGQYELRIMDKNKLIKKISFEK